MEGEDWLQAEEKPSKSEIKRQMHALQAMGERLVGLKAGELAQIPMDEKLTDAIDTARRIKSREGRRRQLQYIGKLMRNTETCDIQAALDALDQSRQQGNQAFHRLEQLRDQLLEQGDTAISDVLTEFPHADRQKIRQLVLSARREQQRQQGSASSRKLFKYLRELQNS